MNNNENKKLDEINANLIEINNKMQQIIICQKENDLLFLLGFWLSIAFNFISLIVFAIIVACDKNLTKEKRDRFIVGWTRGLIVLISTLILLAVFCCIFFAVLKFVMNNPEKFVSPSK